jgi:hypoxanthine phosphoribosyltransferase
MFEGDGQKLERLISREDLLSASRRCAETIKQKIRFDTRSTVFVCVLKGAIFFFYDVLEYFDVPDIEIDFCKLSSYAGSEPTGSIHMELPCQTSLKGKSVVVFEDIIDTGFSVSYLHKYFRSQGVAEVMICVLLDKPGMRKVDVSVDFSGIKVPNDYLVGYGLDFNQKYRLLKEINILKAGSQRI